MKIYIASDHAGFELKEKLKMFLADNGYEAVDAGAYQYDESDDYPDFVVSAAQSVSREPLSRGIILGGSGQGEAIAANRVDGVRAALYYGGPLDIVKLSRTHNDANVLSLAARFMNEEEAKEATKLFLETPFSDEERHQRRIKKIDELTAGGNASPGPLSSSL
ncbi:MAG: RpiB/LacA/LacB family sugar-phosphate isomerase [Patescibacteria group bacterium]|nr:RpiB/LacA/LacB family sugar-phosphate isomerase [Patescibacteria group bacterium]